MTDPSGTAPDIQSNVIAARDERRLTLKQQVEALEREIIAAALQRRRWRVGKVALELGLSRVGLANKMKRYGFGTGAKRG